MNKKRISIFISILLVICISLIEFNVYAQNIESEGVFVNKPDVTFCIKGDESEQDIKDILLNNETLNLNEIKYFDMDSNSTEAYVLVDVSGSMNKVAVDSIKDTLIEYAETFGDDDRFVLYTVGNNATKILNGGESDDEIENAIKGITKTWEDSSLYNSLNDIYDEALYSTNYDRKLVLAVTDGKNWNNKTGYTKVLNKYNTHSLPLYSLVYNINNSSSSNDYTDLVEESGGSYLPYTGVDGNEQLKNLIDNYINNVTVVKCRGQNNIIDSAVNNNVLNYTIGDEKVHISNIAVENYQSDDISPKVSGDITYDKNKSAFVINFSENVEVDENNISIVQDKKNITISKCDVENNTLYIFPKGDVYSGKYMFNLSGVTDNSTEKNKLQDSTIEQSVKATNPAFKVLKGYWWISLIVIFLIAIYLILLLLKKKKNVRTIKEIFETQIEEEKVEVKHTQVVKHQYYTDAAQQSGNLSMLVEIGSNRQRVDIVVVSSVIVGRSAQCDISIEDAKLSRQHFAIEVVNGKFAVSDLNTTNGTYVNGIKISSKQLVMPGDKIAAGTSLFIML